MSSGTNKTLPVFLFFLALIDGRAHAISEVDRIKAISETDKAIHSTESQMKEYLREKAEIKEVAGNRWVHLPLEEKKDAIIHSMVILGALGIVYDHNAGHYYDAVEAYLNNYPDRGAQTVTEILAAVIYETQPESRTILEKL